MGCVTRGRAANGPRSLALLLVLLLFPIPPVIAKDGPSSSRAKPVVTPLGAEIDSDLKSTYPELWGTVLVAKGDEVVLLKGYGFADYKAKPCAPDSLFELASMTKQFTAAAILRLEQQKKLKTTDSLEKFFKDVPKDKKGITLDHLLHHTAGIDPMLGVPYSWTGTRDQYVPQMLDKALVEVPGKKFSYSNVGYALLAAVVEAVTHKSFEDYLRSDIFGPAKLVDTGFIGDDKLIESDRVTVRKADDMEPDWTAAKWWYGWGYRGMGGIVSTAPDLMLWHRALRGDKVLGTAAKKKLYEPALDKYACGWLVDQGEHGNTKVSHTGGVRGYGNLISRWLDDDVVVIFLSNGKTDVYAVERTIAGHLFK